MAVEAAILVSQNFETWGVRCDGAGCDNTLWIACRTDRQAIELALDTARRLGWRIEPDRFIRQRDDLCPECRKAKRPA